MTQESTVDQAWFVNKPADVDEAAVADHLALGIWRSATPQAHAELLGKIRVGDRIALKSVANRQSWAAVLQRGSARFHDADLCHGGSVRC